MSGDGLKIQRINTSCDDARRGIAELRMRLSPKGNVVSAAGRQRTIEVFGEELSPTEVVDRICHEVRSQGLSAVLDYTRRIDGVELTSETMRVPEAELRRAYEEASPDFLKSIRRVRENIAEFQDAILHRDVRVNRLDGSLIEPAQIVEAIERG